MKHLFKLLKNSKDPISLIRDIKVLDEKIYIKLKNSDDIFLTLKEYLTLDHIGKSIINLKNFEALKILGHYEFYKDEFKKNLYIDLIYPIFIAFLTSLYFKKMSVVFLVFFFTTIGFNIYISKKFFQEYVNLLFFYFWVKNKISFQLLNNIINLENIYRVDDIYHKITKKKFINLEIIEEEISNNLKENEDKLKNIRKYTLSFSVFFTGLILTTSFIFNFYKQLSIKGVK